LTEDGGRPTVANVRTIVSGAALLAALVVTAPADAHTLNPFRAMEAGTASVARKYPAAEIPVVYCPQFPGHVHRIRCNFEFLRGFQLCQGFVAVRYASRRSHRLKRKVGRATCGVPGGPQSPY
jgi:hypothetical protein